MNWLDRMIADDVRILNTADMLKWNASKTYLHNMRDKGASIVPLEIIDTTSAEKALAVAKNNHLDTFILKPLINACGINTYKLQINEPEKVQAALDDIFKAGKDQDIEQKAILQPFVKAVEDEGEWSLIFFNGKYSHAVLKKPAKGNFLVQSRWGGLASTAEPSEELIKQARKTLDTLDQMPLYARVDGFFDKGHFMLLELELNEPYLFFSNNDNAPSAFADAVEQQTQNGEY